MGSLRSKFNHKGLTVNGVTLGDPPILTDDLSAPQAIEDAWFIWDDSRIPSGLIQEDGSIVLDEPENDPSA